MPSVAIQGAKELDRKLRQLEPKLAKKILRTSLRKAARPVQQAARELAPFKTGQLRKAIKVRAMKRKRGRLGIRVTVGSGDFIGKTYYAAFLEYGTKRGERLHRRKTWVQDENGRWKRVIIRDDRRGEGLKAQRYMKRAADNTLSQSVHILIEELRRGIREATK